MSVSETTTTTPTSLSEGEEDLEAAWELSYDDRMGKVRSCRQP